MPSYMLRDRDGIYGEQFCRRVKNMGIEEVLTVPQSPWQNPYAERLVGSVRRECLDHVIILGEQHLRRIMKSYFAYYHRARTHLALGKDAPEPRQVHPPSMGDIVELPEVGGLHPDEQTRALQDIITRRRQMLEDARRSGKMGRLNGLCSIKTAASGDSKYANPTSSCDFGTISNHD
jgi:hypothetical protein